MSATRTARASESHEKGKSERARIRIVFPDKEPGPPTLFSLFSSFPSSSPLHSTSFLSPTPLGSAEEQCARRIRRPDKSARVPETESA